MTLPHIHSFLFILVSLTAAGDVLWGQPSPTFREIQEAAYVSSINHIGKDGKPGVSKQFRRWEWFWETRLTDEGRIPSPMMYRDAREQHLLLLDKAADDVQSKPQWKEVGPVAPTNISSVWNGIGRLNAIAFSSQNSSVVWVGSAAGGLWKSTNGGGKWVYVPITGMPMAGISDIAIDPNNDQVMYVATGDANYVVPGQVTQYPMFSHGVVKTTDGGQTWNQTALSYQLSSNGIVARLWLDPTDNNTVLATSYGAMLKTTDGGATWRSTLSPGYFRDVVGRPSNPNVVYAATHAFTGSAGVFRSTDKGDTWVSVLTLPGISRVRLAVTPANPDLLLVLAVNRNTMGLGGVYRSTDGGSTFGNITPGINLLGWQTGGGDPGGQGDYDLALTISPTNPSLYFVGGVNVWSSSNGGANWKLSAHWTGSQASYVHADHHFLAFQPNTGHLFSVHDGGVARSTNNGSAWADVSEGLKIQQFYSFDVSPTVPTTYLGGSQDNGTTMQTSSWSRHVLDGDGMACLFDPTNANVAYASQPYGTFYRTVNGPQNGGWQVISQRGQHDGISAWVTPIAIDAQNPNTIYIGYGNLYRSTNRGTSWAAISSVQTNSPIRVVAVSPVNSGRIAFAYLNQIYHSTNGGSNWSQITGIPSQPVTDIKFHPTRDNEIYITFGGFSNGSKVFRYSQGQLVNITGSTLPNVPTQCVEIQTGVFDRIFIGTDLGVYYRDEGMQDFLPYGSGGPETPVTRMKYVAADGMLKVSTYGRGVWEVPSLVCTISSVTITAVGSTNVCNGDTVTLTAPAGYSSYLWSSGDTNRTIRLSGVGETGDYSVSVTNANQCRGVSNSLAVVIRRTPSKPRISKVGNDSLRTLSFGVSRYKWYRNDTLIIAADGRQIHATQSGVYKVVVSNDEDCYSESDEFEFTMTNVIGEVWHDGKYIRVFPNPASSDVIIEGANGYSMIVTDIGGQPLHSTEVETDRLVLPIGNLPNGLVVLRFRAAYRSINLPVLINR